MSIAHPTMPSLAATRPHGIAAPGRGTWLAALLCLIVAAPLLALLGFIGQPTQGLWAHLASTVLPEYLRNSALLCLGVGVGTLALGAGAGWLVTMYRFPGQRLLNWVLVLPLAMPAYVLAYAYTDFLQVSGPLQTYICIRGEEPSGGSQVPLWGGHNVDDLPVLVDRPV